VRLSNKNIRALSNGSRLMYQTAGPRSGARLGIGRGVALIHGTEWPIWENAKAKGYLLTRFSDTHPQRLAIFEGTARGKNHAYDEWMESDTTKVKRIFLAAWMREDRVLDRTSDAFKLYWNGHLTTREQHWRAEVQKIYGVHLTDEQLAWKRYYTKESMSGDEKQSDQEMPMLPEDAFEASGISFLNADALRHARRCVGSAKTPARWRYEWGPRLEETRVKKTIAGREQLWTWEEPQPAQGYVVAAVPGYSSTQNCPVYACSAWRATRDELVQVAEFADEECGQQAFSWVIVHLLGTYHAPRKAFILEIVGSGGGVLEDLKRIEGSGWGTMARRAVSREIAGSAGYIWRRPDSYTGAARQWRSSPENRQWLFARLRDTLARGLLHPRSEALLAELERVRQIDDTFVPEGRDASDHRVVAAALAVEAWAAQLRPIFERVQGPARAVTVEGRVIENFFARLGQPQMAAAGERR
jgi:hypothetical protein